MLNLTVLQLDASKIGNPVSLGAKAGGAAASGAPPPGQNQAPNGQQHGSGVTPAGGPGQQFGGAPERGLLCGDTWTMSLQLCWHTLHIALVSAV